MCVCDVYMCVFMDVRYSSTQALTCVEGIGCPTSLFFTLLPCDRLVSQGMWNLLFLARHVTTKTQPSSCFHAHSLGYWHSRHMLTYSGFYMHASTHNSGLLTFTTSILTQSASSPAPHHSYLIMLRQCFRIFWVLSP